MATWRSVIDNRVFDRHGNLFVAIVTHDFDQGWMCEEWQDHGEYEEVQIGMYGDCEECRRAAFRQGLKIAEKRAGRLLHHYESPEQVKNKLRGYPRCDSEARFMCECPCCNGCDCENCVI